MRKRDPLEYKGLQRIFKDLYLVEIPEMYLRSLNDVRNRGSYTVGDPEEDFKHQKRTAKAYRTINDIFELYQEGVDIFVVKYDDTKKIFEAIEDHLLCWMRYLSRGMGASQCPFDELLALDRFASKIYDKSKFVFTKENYNIFTTENSSVFELNPNIILGTPEGNFGYNPFLTLNDFTPMRSAAELKEYKREGVSDELVSIASKVSIPLSEIRGENQEDNRKSVLGSLKFAND
jgi:hypothetical protein